MFRRVLPTRFILRLGLETLPFLFFFVALSVLTKQPNVEILQEKEAPFSRGNKGDLASVENFPLQETRPMEVRLKRFVSPVNYVYRVLPAPTQIYKEAGSKWEHWGPTLEFVKDYFRYLRLSQSNCRKLKRMGGNLCSDGGDENHMDGHKYICMDPSLMLFTGKGDPKECLIYSYGTHFDTSFDEVMLNIPCQVHMYDVLNYDPPLAKEHPNAFFHLEGLAGGKYSNFFSNVNYSADMDTLRGHVMKNNLEERLIHILKVDIENAEWEAFANIAKDPIFDAVGQVALEVHALEVVKGLERSWSRNISTDKWLQEVQGKYDVLRAIESRGFRRVLYWDNYREEYPYFDEEGIRYETSGELLYVNTNWYDPSFMKSLADRGYKFPDVP